MATRAVNPYYNDPNIEAIASNIRRAFVDPNPGQTAVMRQHGRLYGLQADEIERKQRARSTLAGIHRGVQNGTLTPEQAREIAATALEGGIDIKDPAEAALYLAANGGAPESVIGRAFSGTGKAIGQNQAFTTEGREAVAKRENDAAAQRSQIAAGPGYARVAEETRKNKADEEWKAKTRWDKPDHVPEGAAVFPNAEDTRYPGVAPGTVPAPRRDASKFVVSPRGDGTFVYRQAADGVDAPVPSSEKDRVVPLPDESSPTGAAFGVPQPKSPAFPPASALPKTPTPTDINPDEVMKLERAALADVGAADDQWNVDPQFKEAYGDKLPAARQAAAAAYQKSRNAADGQAAYLAALGITPGSKWNAPGMVGRMFGREPGFQPPKGSPVQSAVTGGGTPTPPPAVAAPAPAPAQSAPAAVPPPAQRVPGQIYMTPKGAMRWTGTGWVPPDNVR